MAGDRGEEGLHQLEHGVANAGLVDVDLRDAIALGVFSNDLGLLVEPAALELLSFDHAELAARLRRRRQDDQARRITVLTVTVGVV
ncbi:hypothetical protein D3C85_1531700 [compost metagenome]